MNDSSVPQNISTSVPENYEELLKYPDLIYTQNECYWEIGTIPEMQGWILYIPVSIRDIPDLLSKIIPYLQDKGIAFQIPADKAFHNNIKEGLLGHELFGKVICIFLSDQSLLEETALHLIEISQGFQGTTVASAIHLGGLLYTRYSSFHPITTPNGELIIDNNNKYIKDNYLIPYNIPNWVQWPFKRISLPANSKTLKLLGNKYWIKYIIRNVYKGRIMVGLYQKGLLRFSKCLIKEGVKGMFTDELNRDICSRLLWQKELHQKLDTIIPIPSFIDYFEERGNSYLILEFIDGSKFETYIEEIFLFNSWINLSVSKKLIIIDHLLQIINIFQTLHSHGIVHRDITLTNFMVNRKRKIFLIDLELSYSIVDNLPSIPFQVGTDGYMSPEQSEAKLLPDYKQDIFSIGAVMLAVILRLSPKKLAHISTELLDKYLLFFTGSEILTGIIGACLSKDNNARPNLEEIRNALQRYQSDIPLKETTIEINNKNLGIFIQKATNSLRLPVMVNSTGNWISPIEIKNKNRTIYLGLKKGISGILFLISELKKNGYNTTSLNYVFETNLNFLEAKFLSAGKEVPPGLYTGSSGVAWSLTSILESGLISPNNKLTDYIYNCLFKAPSSLDIETGIAGYGMSILRCSKFLPPEYINERISFSVNHLLQHQQKNGSWSFTQTVGSGIVYNTGFENGTAGIVYFLLECIQRTKDRFLTDKVLLSLNWLYKQSKNTKFGLLWPAHVKTNEGTLFVNGTFGVAVTFIKAWEVFGDNRYKLIAEQALASMPSRAITNDFTFNSGLSGLGEVYLYAYKVFREEKWYDRAKWLANIFLNTATSMPEENYWIQNIIDTPYADLMEGNGAIIHFLLRFSEPEKNSFIF